MSRSGRAVEPRRRERRTFGTAETRCGTEVRERIEIRDRGAEARELSVDPRRERLVVVGELGAEPRRRERRTCGTDEMWNRDEGARRDP